MVGIFGAYKHLVCNHIRRCGGIYAHLRNFSDKHIIGISIDRERSILSYFHRTYVSLIYIGYHSHIVEVGNNKQISYIHIRNHRLPYFHLTRHHNAVDR